MVSVPFPVSLARLALGAAPEPAVQRVTQLVLAKMQTRHPRLFDALARLPQASVWLKPVDAPYGFILHMGREGEVFQLAQEDGAAECQASIAGPLDALISMLEGRADGDALFFSREIVVTGDTEVIVGLRNTLDREEICLMDEIFSLCGPFARPAGLVFDFAARSAQRLKARIEAAHEAMHQKPKADPFL